MMHIIGFTESMNYHNWGITFEVAIKNSEEALIGCLEALQENNESIPEEET
jgi:predicted RNase H-like HicB family nuclease